MLRALGIGEKGIDIAFRVRLGLGTGDSEASLSIAEPAFASIVVEAEVARFDVEKLRLASAEERPVVALQTELASARVTLTDSGARTILMARGAKAI